MGVVANDLGYHFKLLLEGFIVAWGGGHASVLRFASYNQFRITPRYIVLDMLNKAPQKAQRMSRHNIRQGFSIQYLSSHPPP